MKKVSQNLKVGDEKSVFSCRIFDVVSRPVATINDEHELEIFSLKTSNWVNVVPLFSNGDVLLIEQHRFGTNVMTFEVPGGAVDASEKDPTMAAVRELEEETGYTSQRILSMPGFAPNPAIMNNRITYFLAYDIYPLEKPSDHFDPFEQIQMHRMPFSDALRLVRTGQMQHALSALAMLLAENYVKPI